LINSRPETFDKGVKLSQHIYSRHKSINND